MKKILLFSLIGVLTISCSNQEIKINLSKLKFGYSRIDSAIKHKKHLETKLTNIWKDYVYMDASYFNINNELKRNFIEIRVMDDRIIPNEERDKLIEDTFTLIKKEVLNLQDFNYIKINIDYQNVDGRFRQIFDSKLVSEL